MSASACDATSSSASDRADPRVPASPRGPIVTGMSYYQTLIEEASGATARALELARPRPDLSYTGTVGAALVTATGVLHTGVNLSLMCGIGFCAEHSAVANMVAAGESRIARIAAVTSTGAVLPPCGRCRELLYQIDPGNLDTEVVLAPDRSAPLGKLLPAIWQDATDVPLPGAG